MSVNVYRNLLAALLMFGAVIALPLPIKAREAEVAQAQSAQNSPGGGDPQEGARTRRFRRALTRVRPLLERYGYAAAAVATMAEGIGLPTPGQTLLIAGALEAAEGRMNIGLLFILVTLAAIAGNSLGYTIGRWGGRFVLKKLYVNPQRQQRLEDLFRRRGGLVVVFGRFVDGLRQLNGILAGVLKMPWWIFTAYNVAGAVLWTGAWALGTYTFGRRIHVIAGFFHHHRRLLFVLTAALLATACVYIFRTNIVSKAREQS